MNIVDVIVNNVGSDSGASEAVPAKDARFRNSRVGSQNCSTTAIAQRDRCSVSD
jgi:hypothetical protein